MSKFIFNTTAEDFEEKVIKQSFNAPVLVDFWADWCEPCKQLFPILESLINKNTGQVLLAKINTDEEQNLAMSFGIRSLPTVVLFKNGEMVEQFSGVQPESEIQELIQPHLNIETNQDENNEETSIAERLIQAGEIDKAIEYLSSQESLDSKATLMKLLISEQRFIEAKNEFDKISKEGQKNDKLISLKNMIELINIADKTDSKELQSTLHKVLLEDSVLAIENLLGMLKNKDSNSEIIKKSLILSFDLVGDAKIVSKLRRKMSAIIF